MDGHFKSQHDTVEAAEEAGMALRNQRQMLQEQIYDAVTKTRSMIANVKAQVLRPPLC